MNDIYNCTCGKPNWDIELSNKITAAICDTYSDDKGINHIEEANLPQQSEVLKVLIDLMELIFPGYVGEYQFSKAGLHFAIGGLVNSCYTRLVEQIERALKHYCALEKCNHEMCNGRAVDAAIKMLEAIPEIRETLKVDVEAAMAGDPAAETRDEIVLSYPGLKAIAIHRIAHVLYKNQIPLIPRIMSEHAHHETGIDIHPGATVGEGLFIDHGTGVVVGETAIIGQNVKIYQGVTLGALSFPKDEDGYAIRGQKRHPSIEDNVTIYAGATILGDVLIGEGSVIGGNVWLMESIPAGTQVTINKPELRFKTRKK